MWVLVSTFQCLASDNEVRRINVRLNDGRAPVIRRAENDSSVKLDTDDSAVAVVRVDHLVANTELGEAAADTALSEGEVLAVNVCFNDGRAPVVGRLDHEAVVELEGEDSHRTASGNTHDIVADTDVDGATGSDGQFLALNTVNVD